jgi:hypothetical protein
LEWRRKTEFESQRLSQCMGDMTFYSLLKHLRNSIQLENVILYANKSEIGSCACQQLGLNKCKNDIKRVGGRRAF